jgi:hypothetical protein
MVSVLVCAATEDTGTVGHFYAAPDAQKGRLYFVFIYVRNRRICVSCVNATLLEKLMFVNVIT